MGISDLAGSDFQVGIRQTMRSLSKNKVKQVYYAGDADRQVIAPVLELCRENGVPAEKAETMAELGRAAGIDVGTAVIALLK